MSNLEMKHNF